MASEHTHPADEIRRTASLMRERAEAATQGPWQHTCLGSEGCLVLRKSGTIRDRGRGRVARFGQKEWKADHADAEYVAGMHPLVALAVADWLGERARDAGSAVLSGDRWSFGGSDDPPGIEAALKVARAYLGETEAEVPGD